MTDKELKKELKKEIGRQRKNSSIIIKNKFYSICFKNPKKKEKMIIKIFYNNTKTILKFEEFYNKKMTIDMIADIINKIDLNEKEILSVVYDVFKEYNCSTEFNTKNDYVRYQNWKVVEIERKKEEKEWKIKIKNSIKSWSYEDEEVLTGMTEKKALIFQSKKSGVTNTSIMLVASKDVEQIVEEYKL